MAASAACHVDRLDLADEQFEAIHVPEQVWAELTAGDEDGSGLRALRDAGTLTVRSGRPIRPVRPVCRDRSRTGCRRAGRQVARRHALDVTGAIGILLRGAREGTVDLRAELDALRDAGFWISADLSAEVLRRDEDDFE